jgi:hypothetical protein
MDRSPGTLPARFLAAVLTALGVAFLTVGLITLTAPVEADPGSSPDPNGPGASSPSPSSSIAPTGSLSPSVPADRVATRVRVAALGIDLPVIAQQDHSFVPCGVAMYLGEMRQPGADRATYLYAHAQRGMFLPILEASLKEDHGFSMIGMIAEVYTSDDMLFLYEIDRIIQHVPFNTGLDEALAATSDQLWLQTSEGIGTAPKLQIVGRALSSGPADPAKAHPSAKPRRCP